MEDITNEELRAFIGEKADYYMEKFEKFEKGNSVSWNWAAFFFGVLWMFYRKMYLYGLGALGFITIVNVALEIMKTSPVINLGVSLWLWVGFGVFGNYIYYLFVKNKIKEIKEKNQNSQEIIQILERSGGVNKLVLYIFGALAVIYLISIFITASK
ncbi:DUF2628 domain-containing protein [Persephonella sp.]